MIRAIFSLEARRYARSPYYWLGLIFLVAVMVYALANGRAVLLANQASYEAALVEHEETQAEQRKEVVDFAEGDTDIHPVSAHAASLEFTQLLPPAPLGDFGIGYGDRMPKEARLRLWETSADLFANYQVQNPTVLANGRIDTTFAIIVVIPLLMILSLFNVLTTDRAQGTLRAVLAQGPTKRRAAMTRLAFRTASIWLPVILLTSIAAFWVPERMDAAARLEAYGQWLVSILLYGIFWTVLIGYIAIKFRTDQGAAIVALSSWLVLVFVIPITINTAVETVYPAPSRLASLMETRKLIDHFRAHWFGADEAKHSAAQLMISTGRAAGKVAHWSFERTSAILRQYSRRPLDIRAVGDKTISANERSIIALIEAVAAGSMRTAQAHATWLVQPQATSRLLDRVGPMANLYPTLHKAA